MYPTFYFNSRPSARGDLFPRQRLPLCRFQFTPLREGRRVRKIKTIDDHDISIHAPPRGATLPHKKHSAFPIHFNSRPSARGDGCLMSGIIVYMTFQFTPLREGRHMGSHGFTASKTNFNSRPSARGDGSCFLLFCRRFISIHAPPRGATDALEQAKEAGYISIHAPPRGATVMPGLARYVDLFQFTPLREGRRSHTEVEMEVHSNFNSRPSARGDTRKNRAILQAQDFNSRPSARGDTTTARACSSPTYFNSRPSARGDPKVRYNSQKKGRFQFTPLREGRQKRLREETVDSYFNSRPSARGDNERKGVIHLPRQFQFTPLREGRPSAGILYGRAAYFNSRPSARGDNGSQT